MAETVTVNGEARKEVAVLERALSDCQRNCAEGARSNREDHQEIFRRLNGIEVRQEGLVTKLSAVFILVTALATVIGQLLK